MLSSLVFTAQQHHKFVEILESCSGIPTLSQIASNVASCVPNSRMHSPKSQTIRTSDSPTGSNRQGDDEAFANIAKEFGVEAQLVQALAQRLAVLS